MKIEKLLLLITLITFVSCNQPRTKEAVSDSTQLQSDASTVNQTNKTCLDIALEIMETSPTYQKKIRDDRMKAIEKNGGTLTMEVEGSPNSEDHPLNPSENYEFKISESYETRSAVIERFTFDPSKKQLYLYDPVENQLNEIDFYKNLLNEFDKRCGYEELPVVTAVGGQGTTIDWETIAKNTDADGPAFFEGDCKQGIKQSGASSSLAKQGKNSYESENLADYDPRTAWVEAKVDYGIGEFFEIKAPDINTIYNGYQASPAAWKNNSRVKRFKVFRDGKPLCLLDLTDEMGAQLFELPRLENDDPNSIHTFKFKIEDVYKGLKYSDVAISEIEWVLCCMAANTVILTENNHATIDTVEKGITVSGVDISSGLVAKSEIIKIVNQKHLSLLKISCGSRQIEVTANHPLYMKEYGFISIEKYLNLKRLANYEDLVKVAEVLTLNDETGKLEYKKISSIEVMHGVFETYSILKLSKGDTYVANGFVTRTY